MVTPMKYECDIQLVTNIFILLNNGEINGMEEIGLVKTLVSSWEQEIMKFSFQNFVAQDSQHNGFATYHPDSPHTGLTAYHPDSQHTRFTTYHPDSQHTRFTTSNQLEDKILFHRISKLLNNISQWFMEDTCAHKSRYKWPRVSAISTLLSKIDKGDGSVIIIIIIVIVIVIILLLLLS